jgi:tetratricopeptide (TPR) repeat protein
MKTDICLLALILLSTITADAQWPGTRVQESGQYGTERGVSVRGVISSERTLTGAFTVELVGSNLEAVQSTSLEVDGSFQFHSVPQGGYELRITGPSGSIVHHQNVLISGQNQLLTITVSGGASAKRSADPTVSILQLRHKVPAPAQKEYNKGLSAGRKGDFQTALDHLQKAAVIDPEFADAYSGIGVAQLSLGRLEEAAEQFQKAVSLVPDHTQAISNLSIVLSRLKRYGEAGQAARQALKLNPSLMKMRYILAYSLTREQGHENEALDNLERAAVEIPKARLLAADILTHAGRRDDAIRQLEQYLRALPERDADRKNVEERLAQLRQP